MLDCTAHQTSRGTIPSSLLKVYIQYKQDTRAVVNWLVSHGPCRYKRSQALQIKDLFYLAQIVQTKAVEMPDLIAFHFREAIAARNHMTKFFRKAGAPDLDNRDTINHEHFTSR